MYSPSASMSASASLASAGGMGSGAGRSGGKPGGRCSAGYTKLQPVMRFPAGAYQLDMFKLHVPAGTFQPLLKPDCFR